MSEPSIKWKLEQITRWTKEIQKLLYEGELTNSKREIIYNNLDETLLQIAVIESELARISYKLIS